MIQKRASSAAADKQQESTLVYGLRPVLEALDAETRIDRVLLQNGLAGKVSSDLKERIRTRGIPFQFVPPERLDHLTHGGNHQGVVALMSPIAFQAALELLPALAEGDHAPFVLLLDRITDVRNFGAIARTAECAGVDAVVIPDHGSAQVNADAIKTSSGALLRLPVCREANLKTVVNLARQCGYHVVAATEKGATNYLEVDFTQPTLLLMGAEDTGISPDLLRLADCRAQLPIHGQVQSLNVSVAAAIFMYEALRQRSAS